jgi:hypothetical protein
MSKQGIQSLGDFTITTAATQVGDWVTGFQNLLALTANLRLAYGSGGTSIKAYLQTSLDQQTTAIDIACVVFGTASENEVLNFAGQTPKLTQVSPTDGTLTDDTAIDGILGDRFRIKIVSTGTYAGSTVLSARVHPHG